MPATRRLTCATLVVAAIVSSCSRAPTSTVRPVSHYRDVSDTWVDRSPHTSGFVNVNGTRLHYLDWGGRGDAVILLAGLTMNAHVYDDLAPMLGKEFRVIALTRRGHGESERTTRGFQVDTLVADIAAFLDSLGIRRGHLIGHSIAGFEMTAFFLRHPARVGKLVYLDASPAAPPQVERPPMDDPLPEPARPPGWDTSVVILREWISTLFYGNWTDALESNLRARHRVAVKPFIEMLEPGVIPAIVQARATFRPNLDALTIPVLALLPADSTHPRETLARDDSTRRRAREFVAVRLRPLRNALIAQFRALPRSRVVIVPGRNDHYFFITQPDTVASEIRAFLTARDNR
jgi:pimeloyl-ACP methyl ester carboxylesterase